MVGRRHTAKRGSRAGGLVPERVDGGAALSCVAKQPYEIVATADGRAFDGKFAFVVGTTRRRTSASDTPADRRPFPKNAVA